MSKIESDAAWVKALLADERVSVAREKMRAEIYSTWESSSDMEAREECWRLLQLERRFWKQLEKYLREASIHAVRGV